MKRVSEITLADLAGYLRLDYEPENNELEPLLSVAKAYIQSYTGLAPESIDEHEEFVIVVYILVQDMFDNRTLYVEKNNVNKTVQTILDMHSVNLL